MTLMHCKVAAGVLWWEDVSYPLALLCGGSPLILSLIRPFLVLSWHMMILWSSIIVKRKLLLMRSWFLPLALSTVPQTWPDMHEARKPPSVNLIHPPANLLQLHLYLQLRFCTHPQFCFLFFRCVSFLSMKATLGWVNDRSKERGIGLKEQMDSWRIFSE